jgi:rhodanese-related sulfurtransferase
MKYEINLEELQAKLQLKQLDNFDPHQGIALLGIASTKDFEAFHLPGALCVTPVAVEQCQEKFERDKEIVVYAYDSAGARRAARHLTQLGFRKVFVLLGGPATWQASDLAAMGQRQELTGKSKETRSIETGGESE